MNIRKGLFVSLIACFALGCGGGSGSDGVVFQGTLTERGVGHAVMNLSFKHLAGERISDVKICILGECSITDEQGQWGVNVGEFSGGQITIVLDGHGINSSVTTDIDEGAKEVSMDLNHNKGVVTVSNLTIDGHNHSEHDHSEDGHGHDHAS